MLPDMINDLINGDRKRRFIVLCTIGAWFALGAYISTGLIQIVDFVVPGDQSSPLAVFIGGMITAGVALYKTA